MPRTERGGIGIHEVDIPTSPVVSLSLLARALIPLGARALLRSAGLEERSERVLLPGIVFALWFSSVHTVGLLTGSFVMGLWLGPLLAEIASAIA